MNTKDLLQGYNVTEVAYLYFSEEKGRDNAFNCFKSHFKSGKIQKDKLLEVLTIINLNAAQRVSEYFGDLEIQIKTTLQKNQKEVDRIIKKTFAKMYRPLKAQDKYLQHKGETLKRFEGLI